MADEMNIKIGTYTPLWSGGVAKNCDRLHETSIIGSLRFWYEVICRGLGISVCDITSDDNRCMLDAEKYNEGIKKGKTVDDILNGQGMCAVCRIFGCGGWKRRFQFRVVSAPLVTFSFVSLNQENKGWLERIFNGNKAFFGDIGFDLCFYGRDSEFIRSQLLMVFSFIELFGGLGAKMQHGFGQIHLLEPAFDERLIMNQMKQLLNKGAALSENSIEHDYSLSNLVTMDCDINKEGLKSFIEKNSSNKEGYIPCVFDLKYEANDKDGKFGFRRWLKENKGWQESSDASQPKELDLLLGPSSQNVKDDEQRLAGRVFFSMPYKRADGQGYRLRVFAFAPPGLCVKDKHIDVKELAGILKDYLQDKDVFGDNVNIVKERYGSDLVKKVMGGE